MKKTQLFLFSTIFLSLLLICCTDKQAKPEKEIVGKWKFVKMSGDVVSSDSAFSAQMVNGLNQGLPVGPKRELPSPRFEFKENGIFYNDGPTGTYSIEGNKLRMKGWGRLELVDFDIKNDTLTISADFLSEHYQKEKHLLNFPDSIKIEKFILNLFLVKEK